MDGDILEMSAKERERAHVIRQVAERRLRQARGAELLGLAIDFVVRETGQKPVEIGARDTPFACLRATANIYVASQRAGERVLASITNFLQERLRLLVNAAKSAVDRPWNRAFLGFSPAAHKKPRLRVAPASVTRLKGKLKDDLCRGRGRARSSCRRGANRKMGIVPANALAFLSSNSCVPNAAYKNG